MTLKQWTYTRQPKRRVQDKPGLVEGRRGRIDGGLVTLGVSDQSSCEGLVCKRLEPPLVQILVIVANIQGRISIKERNCCLRSLCQGLKSPWCEWTG